MKALRVVYYARSYYSLNKKKKLISFLYSDRTTPITIYSCFPGTCEHQFYLAQTLVYINDISSTFQSKCLLFADDLQIDMQLNISKCKVIPFFRSHTPPSLLYVMGSATLEEVASVRDLGIMYYAKLTFTIH